MTDHCEVDPEGDRPVQCGDNESGEEWSHVWRQDDESRPDIDFTSSFVEEEHVKYEHQTTSLSYSAEEPVQDTSGHEGFKGLRSGAPCRGGSRENKKVEQDGEATCPS